MVRHSLLAISAAVFSLVACGRDEAVIPAPAKAPTPVANIDPASPLSLSLSIDGLFSEGYSWGLSVTPAGEARLSIPFPHHTHVEFQVSDAQLAQLRDAILSERFFELRDTYGQFVFDSSTRRITVGLGEHTKTVELHFLSDTGTQDPEHLRQAQRPVRIWLLVRDWFEHPEAVDLRRYDQAFLKHIAGGT